MTYKKQCWHSGDKPTTVPSKRKVPKLDLQHFKGSATIAKRLGTEPTIVLKRRKVTAKDTDDAVEEAVAAEAEAEEEAKARRLAATVAR
jgi:hypothetical protein